MTWPKGGFGKAGLGLRAWDFSDFWIWDEQKPRVAPGASPRSSPAGRTRHCPHRGDTNRARRHPHSNPRPQIPGAAPGTAPELGEGSKELPKIHPMKKTGPEPALGQQTPPQNPSHKNQDPSQPGALWQKELGSFFPLRIQSKWMSLSPRWERRDDSAGKHTWKKEKNPALPTGLVGS